MSTAPAEELGVPDREAHAQGYRWVCGVDEVGRGPLAGPVVAAAVIFPPGTVIGGLTDSKKLAPDDRRRILPEIHRRAVCTALGTASVPEIDRFNILQASLLAMARAVRGLRRAADYLLVDGTCAVPLPLPQRTLIGGDGRSVAVAAASVFAKEHRDRLMVEYSHSFPGYGFESHKGYPTPAHREALSRLGPCPIHRTTFRGVREWVSPVCQQVLFPDEKEIT